MTIYEYQRRVHHEVILECLCQLHAEILGPCSSCGGESAEDIEAIRRRLCRSYFVSELDLENKTIGECRDRLSETCLFLRECEQVAEAIAEEKAEEARENDVEFGDDQEVELSDEDKAVVDQIFDLRSPTPDIEKIRDATVDALVKEDEKAKEMKDAVDIAKAQGVVDNDPEAVSEAVARMNALQPTSLMGAIINNISVIAVNEVTEVGNFHSVGDVLRDNSDAIKTRAVMVYALYEMANVFGIHRYTPDEVKTLAEDIYAEYR